MWQLDVAQRTCGEAAGPFIDAPPDGGCVLTVCLCCTLKCNPTPYVSSSIDQRSPDPGHLVTLAAQNPLALTTVASSEANWPSIAKQAWTHAHALPPAMRLYRSGRLPQRSDAA